MAGPDGAIWYTNPLAGVIGRIGLAATTVPASSKSGLIALAVLLAGCSLLLLKKAARASL